MPWFAWVLTALFTFAAAYQLLDESTDVGRRLVELAINVAIIAAIIVLGTHYVA